MKQFPAICLTKGKEFIFVFPTDVLYVQSNGSYSDFFMVGGKKITVSKNLKQVDTLLTTDIFTRIHNSIIINLMHIDRVYLDERQEVVLSDRTKLPLSRRRKAGFLSRFTRI